MKNIIKIAEAYVLSRTAYKILLVLSTLLIAIPYIREKIGFIIKYSKFKYVRYKNTRNTIAVIL